MNGEEEKISDPRLVTALKGQARKVHIESFLAAVLLTAISIALLS